MKTFKLILLIALFLSTVSLNAQEKKATFGVKAGLNISSIASDEGNYDNTKSKSGFHAGVTLDYAFSTNWYLLTGLEYTVRGVTIELNPNNQNVTAAYLQLPVAAAFKLKINDDMAIVVSTGPYFSYGIHGEIKQGSRKQDTFSDVALKKFDCGMILGAAFEWRKLCFSLGSELGVVNIMQKGNDNAETRNLTLSVGYKF